MSLRHRFSVALVAWLLLAELSATAAPIRLRNETIEPPRDAKESPASGKTAHDNPQSGLFLIQFTDAPTATERAQLTTMGIDLLRYIPDDTFIARFRNASSHRAMSLTNVKFITPYEAKHKLHKHLPTGAKAGAADNLVRVRIVLAPGADRREKFDVHQLLTRVHGESQLRFTPVIRADIQSSRLETLASSPAVLWIEPDRPMRLHDEVSSKIVAGDYAPNQTVMQALGFTGAGVNVAVADSGLNNGDAATMHPDLFGRTPTFFYYGALTNAADEHSHGTHVSGIVAGNGATGETDDNGALYGLGVAPGASIITQRMFDGDGNFEPPQTFEQLTRDATQAGAVIGSNSWGDDTQGAYDVTAAEYDELVRDADALTPGDQPYILEFSAGNAGPAAQTIGTPAVGKNVIATGASLNDREDLFIYDTGPDTMADFSSRGPCEDGRIKPDVVAPGTWISSAKSASAGDDNSWAPISDYYLYVGGTSQAGPHTSGAAAVFVQYYRATHTNALPSPALVKAALINSATPLDPEVEVGPAPNYDEGWGRVDLTNLIGSDRSYDFTDQSVLLTNNQVWEHRVVVGSPDEPLTITLAYTDVPGLPAAFPALVNDLDLEVVSPDGHLFRGNQFIDGESIPDAVATDVINNVEAVILATPMPGEYIVRVRGKKIVEDSRIDTGIIDQDFALVISGDLPAPGNGVIVLDRNFYTAPSQINITLVDRDLAGQGTASVKVRSATETNGEVIILHPFSSTGTFTGAVTTITGIAVADGRLQIAHGDFIEASYFDTSGGTNRFAYATADLVPPVITGVTSTNEFGQVVVSWTTDEPSTSIVRYSTNSSLSLSATNTTRSTDHSVVLGGLPANQTNKFVVISTDEAGNTSTNNNGGSNFSFVTVPASTVLMLDAGVDSTGLFGIPPLSGYTNTIAQIGMDFSLWATDAKGVPPVTALRPHRAVICRLPELVGNLTSQQLVTMCNNLSNYVASGGSLFIASMDGLSRLEEAGASSFITNVLRVQSHDVDTGVSDILGVGTELVGLGMDTSLDYSAYDDQWSGYVQGDISDTIFPTANSVSVLTDGLGDSVGLRWPKTGRVGPGRVVFFSFPFDAVPDGTNFVNNRAALLRNVLQFLIPGNNGIGNVALDSPAYSLPSQVQVEVADSDLAGLSSITVNAYSPRKTNGVPFTLLPLDTNGIFSGSFYLVPTNAPLAGQLPAADGDVIHVDYYDATAHGTVSATAVVDIQSPAITDVLAEPDYQDVTISWTTSEPSDGLVQLGTTAFLEHSGYDPAISTYHEVTIHGLSPDTEYLFEVSSADIAGNTTNDDNHGNFYVTRTLRPLLPPWFDFLDAGTSTNWSFFDSDDSQSHWELGIPNNSLATNAYSPPNAWGCNLQGLPIDYTENFLISPALFLTNGNSAKLRFKHLYDFTEKSQYDIIEQGQILLLTNNIGNVTTLDTYDTDAVLDWEEVELDLTPFIGQVVYVVWSYQMLSFDTLPRPAWLIDDISVTVSNLTPGVVTVTNNLWQSSWSLTGPLVRSGAGLGTVYTNATPGDYTMTWANVPFYQAPAPQTSTLASGGQLLFTGNYTMVDTNANGIPDAWEQQYLGGAAANHPGSTDTDHDGASDLAEFIAGTNPTNSASVFKITASTTASNGVVQFNWPAASGRGYRVLGSTNGVTWSAASDWMQNINHYSLTRTNGAPYLFRMEVRP